MSKPYLSFDYNYDEEVIRGLFSNLADGIIGINDPIIGFHSYKTKGTMDVQSMGFSVSRLNDFLKKFNFWFRNKQVKR